MNVTRSPCCRATSTRRSSLAGLLAELCQRGTTQSRFRNACEVCGSHVNGRIGLAGLQQQIDQHLGSRDWIAFLVHLML